MKKLLIVGLGLIGGSIAKASKGFFEVYALNRGAEARETARRERTVQDAWRTCEEIEITPDVICLCVPVDAMAFYIDRLGTQFPKALFTDAGSTKGNVLALMHGRRYVGTHPMAGSERSGYAASRGDLFFGATVCVVPGECRQEDRQLILQWILHMGGRPLEINAAAHDRAVAAISHLPHIIASALTETAGAAAEELPQTRVMAAGGFLDITRIAGSDPVMWRAIFVENADAISRQLDDFEAVLACWREMLQQRDGAAMQARFADTRAVRGTFQRSNLGIFPEKGYCLRVRGGRPEAARLLQSPAGGSVDRVEFQDGTFLLHCTAPSERLNLQECLKAMGLSEEEES